MWSEKQNHRKQNREGKKKDIYSGFKVQVHFHTPTQPRLPLSSAHASQALRQLFAS